MKPSILAKLSIVIFLLLIAACQKENPVTPNSVINPVDTTGQDTTTYQDTTFNTPYEDSILCNSTRVLFTTNVQMGYIDGTGIRMLCDSLLSFNATWSPNKRNIIFVGTPLHGPFKDWGLYRIEVENYKISRLVTEETKLITASYSPNMKFIAFAVYNENLAKKVKLYNNLTREVTETTDWLNYDLNVLSWGPDSKKILIDNGYLINIEDHIITRLFDYGGHQIFLPNWSPDGSKVAFCGSIGSQPNIYIYDVNTGENHILFRQDTLVQFSSSWSRDSKQLIFDQRPFGNANSYLCKINIDGTNFMRLTDGSEDIWGAQWFK